MDKNRVPVIVGAAQLTHREKTPTQLDPLRMMAEVSRMAAQDALLSDLPRVDTLYVVNCISKELKAPARDLSNLLRIEPAEAGYTLIGASAPQWLVNRVAERIYRGQTEVALICGAEAFYTHSEVPPMGHGMALYFSEDQASLAKRFAGDVRKPITDLELRYGLVLPVTLYALFENALRAHRGRSFEEHTAELSSFCARFSEIAARNPHAWFRQAKTAAELAAATDANRMIVYPYTKWMCSIMDVNQAAAVLLTSLAKAEALGVPRERMVFLRGAGEAEDSFIVSERPDLWASPSVADAVRQALGQGPISLDEVEFLDFYSCFPAAPRIAGETLGLSPADSRPLTVTGGMPYFGGPGNNYALHAICHVVERLRHSPRSFGLVQALSWFISKHAAGLYSGEPGQMPWKPQDSKAKARLYPRVRVVEKPQGAVRVESYALTYGRDGSPKSAVVFCRDAVGDRCLAAVDPEAGVLEQMAREEPIGRLGGISWDESESKNRFHFS